mmetsp:Transcript_73429/g.153274  ORF Transcript_73429/g.153274 Transcript_73429/m.153274 type:complete len:204 (+) Transcript_73429:3131-3742(+)
MMIASFPSGPGGDLSIRWHAWLYLCMSVTDALLSASKISLAMLAPSGAVISVPDSVRTMPCVPLDVWPLGFSLSIFFLPSSEIGTQKLLLSALYHSPLSPSLRTNVMPIGDAPWNSTSTSCSSAPTFVNETCADEPLNVALSASRVSLSGSSQSHGLLVPTPQCSSSGPGPLSPFSGCTRIDTFFSLVTMILRLPFLRPFCPW